MITRRSVDGERLRDRDEEDEFMNFDCTIVIGF